MTYRFIIQGNYVNQNGFYTILYVFSFQCVKQNFKYIKIKKD